MSKKKKGRHPVDVTDKFSRTKIRKLAKFMIRESTFMRCDLEDIIQELTLDLVQRMPQFDPNKARWSTFVRRVTHNKAADMIRRGNSQMKVEERKVQSLNNFVDDGDGHFVQVQETVRSDEADNRLQSEHIDGEVYLDLVQDIELLLEQLPGWLREICEQLKELSMAEVARKRRMARSTLRGQLRSAQKQFADGNVDSYVAPRKETSCASN